jgi:hypothetical protein
LVSATLTTEQKKRSRSISKPKAGVESAIRKRKPKPAKVAPVGSRSAILTAQWRERRKAVLLNPKGLPRLSLSMLIQESRR